MENVSAPNGFEGCTWYCDSSRTWRVSFRAVGETWWTCFYLDAGHTYLNKEERNTRAEAAIIHALKTRGLLAG